MNARTNLITAALTLALIVPAAASAAVRLPATRRCARSSRSCTCTSSRRTPPRPGPAPTDLSRLRARRRLTKVAKAITRAAKQQQSVSTRGQWAYVPGGASEQVAKAITSASRPR